VNNVKLPGGTELAFSPDANRTKSPSALAINVPPVSPAIRTPDASQGLQVLASIPGFIERDGKYAELFGAGKVEGLDEARQFANQALDPLSKCLAEYVAETGDSGRAGYLLSDLAASLRALIRIRGEKQPQNVADALKDLTRKILVETPASEKVTVPGAKTCGDLATQAVREGESDKFVVDWLKKGSWRSRPYLWIGFASMLATSLQYAAAVEPLDEWVRSVNSVELGTAAALGIELKDVPDRVKDVYEIRVRMLIAGYIEEWIRSNNGAKTSVVQEYHLRNLEKLIALLQPSTNQIVKEITLTHNPMVESSFTVEPNDSHSCDADFYRKATNDPKSKNNQDEYPTWKLQLLLIDTLRSAEMVWATTALEHPDYITDYAAKAKRYAVEAANIDLSCLQLLFPPERRAEAIATRRADALDLFAKVEMANTLASAQLFQLLNRDKAKQRLELALAAVKLGQALTNPFKFQKLEHQASRFLDLISATQSVEASDSLASTKVTLEKTLLAFQ
jgi:hypothetical protein